MRVEEVVSKRAFLFFFFFRHSYCTRRDEARLEPGLATPVLFLAEVFMTFEKL